jgi:hypothetical protein
MGRIDGGLQRPGPAHGVHGIGRQDELTRFHHGGDGVGRLVLGLSNSRGLAARAETQSRLLSRLRFSPTWLKAEHDGSPQRMMDSVT